MTHRLLLALVLAPDVWDLPLVVRRCYPLCVAPPAWSCVRSPLRMRTDVIPGLL
jgi:hypothetical protein